VPRRPRPPLSAREIAAYLSGGRAAQSLGYAALTYPEIENMAMRAAEADAPIAAAMRLDDYFYWYCKGYQDEQVKAMLR